MALGLDNPAAQQQAPQLSYLLQGFVESLLIHRLGATSSSTPSASRHVLEKSRALFKRTHGDPERSLNDVVLIGKK